MLNDFDSYAKEYSETIALINCLDAWVYKRYLPKTRKRVLDIGCGSGDLLKRMSKYFGECYGIDASKTMIEIAKQKSSDFNLTIADANTLPYPDNYFDYVISHTAFHHLDLDMILSEAKRVLNYNGRLVVIDVVRANNKFIRRFQRVVLRYLFSWGRMLLRYGPHKTAEARRFSIGPVWRNHVSSEQELFPMMSRFKVDYGKYLPNARFGRANSGIGYVVWTKV